MSDDKPKPPRGPDDATFDPSRYPAPPPYRPEPRLIGDMQRRDRSDRKPKRRWFGLRSSTPS
jgi:hypothetical protein